METYTDFRFSYLIQIFVIEINTKLRNNFRVYLTGNFYYKVDQNRAILATLDSLKPRLNIFTWLILKNIWKIRCIKTFKMMIHYNKYHSIFNIYSTYAKECTPSSLLDSTNKKFVYRSFAFYVLVNRWLKIQREKIYHLYIQIKYTQIK